MYGGLYPNADADKLYLPRKEGRRSLLVNLAKARLEITIVEKG